MKMQKISAIALGVWMLWTCSLISANGAAPNFVVILGEAQGWTSTSVQMDDTVPDSKSPLAVTPNLERLAREGVRFADFYASSPRCTPTRAALMTGRSPAALHMTFVGMGGGGRESGFSPSASKLLPASFLIELPAGELTIGRILHGAGYATAHFGKWHMGGVSPSAHGFDESDGPTGNGGPDNVENPNPKEAYGMTERAMDFVAREAKAGRPFYVQVSHYPSRGGIDSGAEAFARIKARAPNIREPRRIGAAAETEEMDTTIGLLLAKLDELHLTGNTYVFYTSDHGGIGRNANAPLSSGKGTVWEGGVRVPLIVRGPGIPAGMCIHARASSVDLLPTIVQLAGIRQPLPAGVEGGSLVAVMEGKPGAVIGRSRPEFVIHVPHYDKEEQKPASAILLGDFKLIHSYETGAIQLFDIKKDLSEKNDLAAQQPQKSREMDQRLMNYLREVKAEMPSPNPEYKPPVSGNRP